MIRGNAEFQPGPTPFPPPPHPEANEASLTTNLVIPRLYLEEEGVLEQGRGTKGGGSFKGGGGMHGFLCEGGNCEKLARKEQVAN